MKIQYIGFLPAIIVSLIILRLFFKEVMRVRRSSDMMDFNPFILVAGLLVISFIMVMGILWAIQ